MFTKNELKAQLKQMGIVSTDTVVIHTSMKAIGQVEDGPDGVIDAFCEYLKDGLLLIPTHTWDQVVESNPYYDVRSTVPDIGLIPRLAAFRPDGIRSLHPTHSLWARGKRAEEYVSGEENATSPTTPGFCWDKLAEWNAKIMLIGVGHDKNTFIHAIDERVKLPDRMSDRSYPTYITDHSGRQMERKLYPQYCSKTEDISWFYPNFDEPLTRTGAQTFGQFGEAKVRVVDAVCCREVISRIYARSKEDIFAEHRMIPEELYL